MLLILVQTLFEHMASEAQVHLETGTQMSLDDCQSLSSIRSAPVPCSRMHDGLIACGQHRFASERWH